MTNPAPPNDTALVELMKSHVDRWGLWPDVERAYNQWLSDGEDPETACFWALYDWGLLDYRNGSLVLPWS